MERMQTGLVRVARMALWVAPFVVFGLLAFDDIVDWYDTRQAYGIVAGGMADRAREEVAQATNRHLLIDFATSVFVFALLMVLASALTRLSKRREELAQSERRFRAVFEDATDGILLLSDGLIADCNKRFAEMCGRERSEILGRTPYAYSPETQADGRPTAVAGKELLERVASGRSEVFEWRYERPDGSHVDVEVSLTKTFADDKPLMVSVVRDVTERRRVRAVVEQSRREKQLVLDSISDLVVYHESPGRVAWSNRAAALSVGRGPKEMPGVTCYEAWHGRSLPCENCPVYRAFDSGRTEEGEVTTQDGAVWHIQAYPARDEDGQVIGVVETARDITHQVLAVRALRETEERFQTFMLSVNDIIWSARADMSEMLFVNPAAERVYGRPASDFFENPGLWNEVVHPDYSHVLVEKQRQLDEKGQADVEYPILRPDGQVRWLHDRTAVFEAMSGGEKRLGGIAMDITVRKEAEAESKLRHRQLVQADRMISLGILVSGVAHEINNPNHFIMSNAGQLQRMWGHVSAVLEEYYKDHGDFMLGGRKYSVRRERIPEMISSIVEGATRIRNIVNELRDYARDQADAQLESVHPNDVLRSALALLSSLLKKSTNRLTVSMSDDLPRVQANYQRIEQVLINLVQNACQALESPDQAIRISTHYDAVSRRVVFEVSDEGVGIPEESLEHITDPFFTTKRESAGMGLGLSISSSIMIEHGGTLEFESQERVGTTARAWLPISGSGGDA